MTWNRHGIDWTAYDEEEKAARLCQIAQGMTDEAWDRVAGIFFGAMFTAAGLIWWMLLCP